MVALIDTGIFFGFYSVKDKHHLDSIAIIFHAVEGKWGRLYITNHILDETLTLFKYRGLPVEVFIKAFIESETVKILHVDREIELKALELFKNNLHIKGYSYTDAVSEVVSREFDFTLLSYDSGFQVRTIGRDYWICLDEREKKRIKNILSRFGYDLPR
jgi:predicted nucleic acid-binding protein